MLLACAVWFALSSAQAADAERVPPPVMLAKAYRGDIALADYWVSEKLDGVRGYWDGEHLITRGGAVIAAPDWFTAAWPRTRLDGELWAGRGRFETASAVVRKQMPDAEAWRELSYRVFDVPDDPRPFTQRLDALRQIVAATASPRLRAVEQYRVNDADALRRELERIVALGGEGLVLHRGDSLYSAGRSDDLLKLKPYDDAEARVIAHVPGQGKYTGLLGALLVETPAGVRFSIGTGFSDAQRRVPPPPGCLITYRHRGVTSKGVPRFASFLRVRDDEPAP
jgi:DNA ligase-1